MRSLVLSHENIGKADKKQQHRKQTEERVEGKSRRVVISGNRKESYKADFESRSKPWHHPRVLLCPPEFRNKGSTPVPGDGAILDVACTDE